MSLVSFFWYLVAWLTFHLTPDSADKPDRCDCGRFANWKVHYHPLEDGCLMASVVCRRCAEWEQKHGSFTYDGERLSVESACRVKYW